MVFPSFIALERRARNALACLIGKIHPLEKITPQTLRAHFEEGRIRKILFIRPHQGLGDLLLATPVFKALKNACPALQIHFLADTYNVIAIGGNPRLDRCWVWDKRAMRLPWRLIAFLRRLRKERYDVAIPLSSHVPSFTSFWLARASGARWVLGYSTLPFYGGANWSRWLAHVELVNRPPEDPEWEKFMEFARAMGAGAGG